MEIKTPMYIVAVASAAGGEAPKYNSVFIKGVYSTLDEAKANLRKIADEWKEIVCDENWKPGYCSDEYGCKWADHFYSEDCTTAWHDGTCDNWERVEIISNANEYGEWLPPFGD